MIDKSGSYRDSRGRTVQPTGRLPRRRNARRPIQVLVYLAREAEGDWEYLLLRRVPRIGGFWQGVTGAPEEGEGIAQAAHREVLEETGFSLDAVESIGYSYRFPVEDEWRHLYDPRVKDIVEHVFVGEPAGGDPKLSWEHDMWRWCTIDEAAGLLKYPNNLEALKRCASFLSNKTVR